MSLPATHVQNFYLLFVFVFENHDTILLEAFSVYLTFHPTSHWLLYEWVSSCSEVEHWARVGFVASELHRGDPFQSE